MLELMLILLSPIILIVITWTIGIVYNLVVMAASCGDMPSYKNVREKMLKDEYKDGFKRRHYVNMILTGF